jgi:hypothetical protein
MSNDIDLADLRRRVERTPSDDDDLQAIPKSVMVALLDRIEALEAEAADSEYMDFHRLRADRAEARLARVKRYAEGSVENDVSKFWGLDLLAILADEQEKTDD